MAQRVSRFHRILLWLASLDFAVFGLGFYLAPLSFNALLGVPTPDPIAVRALGGFLLGGAVAALLAAINASWSEARIVTLSLITWNLLNTAGMAFDLLVNDGPAGLWPNVAITAFFGITLAIAYGRGPRDS